MSSDMNAVNINTTVAGTNSEYKKESTEKTVASPRHPIKATALVSIETVVGKDQYGIDQSTSTSNEELIASNNNKKAHKDVDRITDSFRGVTIATTDSDKHIDKVESKQLLQSIKRFEKILKKLVREGDATLEMVKSALLMSISGVASIATGSQLVNTALIQDSVKHLSKIDKSEILKLSEPQISTNMSRQMIALGLVLAARPTNLSANESTAKYQQQPKDSFSDMTNNVKTFIQDGMNTLESSAKQNSQQNRQIESNRKIDS